MREIAKEGLRTREEGGERQICGVSVMARRLFCASGGGDERLLVANRLFLPHGHLTSLIDSQRIASYSQRHLAICLWRMFAIYLPKRIPDPAFKVKAELGCRQFAVRLALIRSRNSQSNQ